MMMNRTKETYFSWEGEMNNTKYYSSGIGFGCALAIAISWTAWHSIWWAILHGLLGWIYVIYYAIQYM